MTEEYDVNIGKNTGKCTLSEPNTERGDHENAQPSQITGVHDSVGWAAAFDPTTNAWYYYNSITGQRQWDPPPGWIPCADNEEQTNKNQPTQQVRSGYYYTDAHGIDQGPFSIERLRAWRSSLPMDLPIWYQNDEGEVDLHHEQSPVKKDKSLIDLAQVLGDGDLLSKWRSENPKYGRTSSCAAPSATVYESTITHPNTITSLAEAVIAGLPPDDEDAQLSRAATSAGHFPQHVVAWFKQQSMRPEDYTATALHTAGRGKVQSASGDRESLYADMGSWIDPRKMEEQMLKAKNSKKRKLTSAEIHAVKQRKRQLKERKKTGWLYE